MQQFRIKPESIPPLIKKVVVRASFLGVIALSAGIAIPLIAYPDSAGLTRILPIVLLLATGAFMYGIRMGIKRQRRILETYLLTIDSEGIMREQDDTPSIRIAKHEVKEIVKGIDGSFGIMGANALNAIGVPAQIEAPDVLEARLADLRAIRVLESKPLLVRFSLILPLFTVLAMVITFVSDNKYVVAVTGTMLFALFIWSMVVLRSSKNVPSHIRRTAFLLVPVLLAVVAAIALKFMD